jgi:hypothetical protein
MKTVIKNIYDLVTAITSFERFYAVNYHSIKCTGLYDRTILETVKKNKIIINIGLKFVLHLKLRNDDEIIEM